MSRPQSVTEGHGSTFSLTKKAGHRSIGTSNIALFLANLRLLDLDLRSDWPRISARDFDTRDVHQNQKRRITCVEWALYRLFEIWDRPTTRDKLKPFFPPLEPLQSLNLRAALYRCLTDVKKNGALGRDTVLRKTMLDDCKGDKLEEILLIFSAAVVRKQVSARTHARDAPLAQRLATTTDYDAVVASKIPILLLAHRASLSANLKTRATQDESLRTLQQATTDRGHVLEHCTTVMRNRQFREAGLPTMQVKNVHQQVEEGCMGSALDGKTLLHGASSATGNAMEESTFQEVWELTIGGHPVRSKENAEATLLKRVCDLAKTQNHRLQAWKYRMDRQPRPVALQHDIQKSGIWSREPVLDFTRHHTIRLSDEKPLLKGATIAIDRESPYDAILADMKASIKDIKISRKPRATDLKPAPEAMSIHGNPLSNVPSLAAVTRVTDLNHDLFSPAKLQYEDTEPVEMPYVEEPRYHPPKLSSTEPEDPSMEKLYGHAVDSSEALVHQLDHLSINDNNISPLSGPMNASPSAATFAAASPPSSPPIHHHQTLAERTLASMGISSFSYPPSSPSPLPISAAVPSVPQSPEPQHADLITLPPIVKQSTRMSLADSTRLSIASSLARTKAQNASSAAQNRALKNHADRPRTSMYPINQFETPVKTNHGAGLVALNESPDQDSEIGWSGRELVFSKNTGDEVGGTAEKTIDDTTRVGVEVNLAVAAPMQPRRDITPINKLFEQDADYESVFKSRPKVKTSPLSSPVRR